jgi:hypothetical protein
MNYLVQFLSVLNQKEVEKLKQIELKGKENELLSTLLQYKKQNVPRDIILEKLQMTESHFYKSCSILLDKCYAFLFNHPFETLKFLSKRDLYQNLKHEIFQLEKSYSSDLKFNLLAFELLQRGSYKNHEEKIIHHFAENIKSITKNEENFIPGIEYFLEIRRIRSKIFEYAAQQKNMEAEQLKTRLEEIRKELNFENHGLALFHWYHAVYNYNHLFGDINENPIEFLENALKASKMVLNYLDFEDILNTRCKIAENLYYQSKFEDSYKHYSQIAQESPEIFFEDFYHLTKYVQVLLILNHLEQAEKILDEHFLNYLHIMHPTRGTMSAINYTKLFLLQKNYSEAHIAIQKARFLNDKNFYLPYEYEIRLLEITLAFLEGFDANYFSSAVKKHYKYFKTKGLKLGESNYVNYLYFIEQVAKSNASAKKFEWKPKLKSIYKTFQAGSYALYGKLLNLCLQKNE